MKNMILLVLVVSILFTACQTEDSIKIGVLSAQTGYASVWGLPEKNAVILATEELNKQRINGKQVKLIFEDTMSQAQATSTATNKLIYIDKVKLILGPTWTMSSEIAAPIAEENKVLLISPSKGGESEIDYNYYFMSMWPSERNEIKAVLENMKTNKVTRVVVIYSLDDPWSVLLKYIFNEVSQEYEVTILNNIEVQKNDYKTLLQKIKELNPDAIYDSIPTMDQRGLFLKQKTELGIEIQSYSTTSTEDNKLLEVAGKVSNVFYPFPIEGPKEKEFIEKYVAMFGSEPSPGGAYAYDAANLVFLAMQNGKTTPEEIRDYLINNITDYQGASNVINFDKNGRVKTKEFKIKMIKDGKFTEIYKRI